MFHNTSDLELKSDGLNDVEVIQYHLEASGPPESSAVGASLTEPGPPPPQISSVPETSAIPVVTVAETGGPEAVLDRPRLEPDGRRPPTRRQVHAAGDLLGHGSVPTRLVTVAVIDGVTVIRRRRRTAPGRVGLVKTGPQGKVRRRRVRVRSLLGFPQGRRDSFEGREAVVERNLGGALQHDLLVRSNLVVHGEAFKI